MRSFYLLLRIESALSSWSWHFFFNISFAYKRKDNNSCLCCLPHGFFLRVVSLKSTREGGQQEDFNRKEGTLPLKKKKGSFAYFFCPFEASIFCLVSLLRKTKKRYVLVFFVSPQPSFKIRDFNKQIFLVFLRDTKSIGYKKHRISLTAQGKDTTNVFVKFLY